MKSIEAMLRSLSISVIADSKLVLKFADKDVSRFSFCSEIPIIKVPKSPLEIDITPQTADTTEKKNIE